MWTTREPSRVRLPDGRKLSYAEWGDPEGSPVLLMHGWPGSRLAGRLVAPAVIERGVRLIVPDRPGMGRSDPLEGRTLVGWARDTAALADALDLGRFAVVGYSGGGPYALACAHFFHDRLSGVALVSALGPLDSRKALSTLPPHLKLIFPLARRVSAVGRVPTRMISFGVRRFPGTFAAQARLAASAADRRVLARESVFEALRDEYTEAFRQGIRPVSDEVRLFAGPWGFPLNHLPPGIHLYHGDADRFVPDALGRCLAGMLPSCRSRFVPGAGHFWIVDHFAEVLEDLENQRQGR